MVLFKKAGDLRQYLVRKKLSGSKLGFVPTMGALHPGHMALIDEAKKHSKLVLCSIFVNPTQFNDPGDYQNYPLSIETDIYQLEKRGTDILFLPSVTEIYPGGTSNLENYDLGYLDKILEGRYRPGHFQGVCQVMSRLLGTIDPDYLFMGQKDFQQGLVVRRLMNLIGSQAELRLCQTVREPDGLAMSSRNSRLGGEERKKAIALIESLRFLKMNLQRGNLSALVQEAESILTQSDFRVDYVEIADLRTLEPILHWDGKQKPVALAAAFQNQVRLIDNLVLADEPKQAGIVIPSP
jgi:pantoate--beta-alanine ligase